MNIGLPSINYLRSMGVIPVNEAMEFKFELTAPQNFMECLQNRMCFIDLLKKWIADASGHDATYASLLDPVESIYII